MWPSTALDAIRSRYDLPGAHKVLGQALKAMGREAEAAGAFKLCLRPPRDNEWPICRMLLPETFANPASRTYLLGIRDEAPHIVAAAFIPRRA